MPGEQREHVAAEVAPAATEKNPAAQRSHDDWEVKPTRAENEPAGQGVQVNCPGSEEYVPAGHGVHVDALDPALPAGHFTQFFTSVPTGLYWP